MITLAVPELDVAYFSELANVMAAADRRGCTVLIHATGSRRDRELSTLNGFDAQFTDGVILSALTLRQRDLDNHEKHLPVVPLGERHTPGSLDHVGIDNIAAAREATAHLLARGRRRIAVVGGSLRGRQGTDRLRTIGYAEALKAAGLPFDGDLVAPVDAFHWLDGARAPSGRTHCCVSTTTWLSARCAHSTTEGCGCRTTSTWSASTTSRRRGTASRRSRRWLPTRRASPGRRSICSSTASSGPTWARDRRSTSPDIS